MCLYLKTLVWELETKDFPVSSFSYIKSLNLSNELSAAKCILFGVVEATKAVEVSLAEEAKSWKNSRAVE